MNIRELLFGDPGKNYSEIRDLLDQLADVHGDPGYRNIRSEGKDLHGKLERQLTGFLEDRGDLETFTRVMIELDHQVSSSQQAVNLYVDLFRQEELDRAEAVNRKLGEADKSLGMLLEDGLKGLRSAVEERESR